MKLNPTNTDNSQKIINRNENNIQSENIEKTITCTLMDTVLLIKWDGLKEVEIGV